MIVLLESDKHTLIVNIRPPHSYSLYLQLSICVAQRSQAQSCRRETKQTLNNSSDHVLLR